MTFNYESMYSTAVEQTTKPVAENNSGDFEHKPRFYLDSGVDNYIRIVPYLDENNQGKLFRQVTYHKIPYTFTTKEGQQKTENKIVLCESLEKGQRCRFCELAYKLKNSGDKLTWFKYSRVVDYLVLGTALVEKETDDEILYLPKPLRPRGNDPIVQPIEPIMGAIFLSGISKQNIAFDQFLNEDIASLAKKYPTSFPKKATPAQVLGNVIDYNEGMVIKIHSKKNNENRWSTTLEVMPAYQVALPSSDINLDVDYMNPTLYKPENIDRTYAQFEAFIMARIGGSTATVPSGSNPSAGAVFNAPGVYMQPIGQATINPEDEAVFGGDSDEYADLPVTKVKPMVLQPDDIPF